MSLREALHGEQCALFSFLSHSKYPLCGYKFLYSPVVNEIGELIPAVTTLPLFPIFAKWMLTWTILSHELFPLNTCMRWADEALSTFHEAGEDIPPAGLKRWLMTWNSHHANKGYISLAAFLIPCEPKLEYLSQFTQLLAEVQIWTVLTLLFHDCL